MNPGACQWGFSLPAGQGVPFPHRPAQSRTTVPNCPLLNCYFLALAGSLSLLKTNSRAPGFLPAAGGTRPLRHHNTVDWAAGCPWLFSGPGGFPPSGTDVIQLLQSLSSMKQLRVGDTRMIGPQGALWHTQLNTVLTPIPTAQNKISPRSHAHKIAFAGAISDQHYRPGFES